VSKLVQNANKLPQPAAARLRSLTPARVGLGRTGISQQTRDVLAFQLSHAQARDAIHARMDTSSFAVAIREALERNHGVEVVSLHSEAPDRATYLQRPDLGRRLDEASRNALSALQNPPSDVSIIVADGLSALAVERHVLPLLEELLPHLKHQRLAPLCIVEQGRVAIGDEIGSMLSAKLTVMLIGERPGLSSPDSLGTYLTWNPRIGRTDAERNCISNIRAEGLSYREAALQIVECVVNAQRKQFTGVALHQEPGQLAASVLRAEQA
jgi:ethanolamine ammonia-lyase small subunit